MTYVRDLAEHIIEGPDSLVPRDNPDDEYLYKLLTLEEFTFLSDPKTQWQIWMPTTDLRPNLLLPVLRRVIYQGRVTLETLQERGTIEWPDIAVDYYQLSEDDLGVLDALARKAQKAGLTIQWDMDGLFLSYWYGPPGVDLQVDLSPVSPSFYRSLRLHDLGLPGLGCGVFDEASAALEFNQAWLKLWNYLDSVCAEDRRARPLEEHWRVTPRRFADRLLDDQDRDSQEPILVVGNRFGPDTIREFAGA